MEGGDTSGGEKPVQSFQRRDVLERRNDPPEGFATQNFAQRAMQMISQPSTLPLPPLPPGPEKNDPGFYVYDYVDTAGAGVTVYVIDDGANKNHPVSLIIITSSTLSLIKPRNI